MAGMKRGGQHRGGIGSVIPANQDTSETDVHSQVDLCTHILARHQGTGAFLR